MINNRACQLCDNGSSGDTLCSVFYVILVIDWPNGIGVDRASAEAKKRYLKLQTERFVMINGPTSSYS